MADNVFVAKRLGNGNPQEFIERPQMLADWIYSIVEKQEDLDRRITELETKVEELENP